jgi:hypothetical protein
VSITASGTGLIGRKKELKHIISCLKKGENVALIAPRRFGKASLIAQVLTQLKSENHPTCSLDLFAAPTAEMLSSVIIKEVLKNLKLHKAFMQFRTEDSSLAHHPELVSILADFPFINAFSDPLKDKRELLAESLDFPETFANQGRKQMICAYEEMGNIQHMEEGANIAALIKSKLAKHSHTSYIFSTHHLSAMKQITGTGRSTLLKKENIIQLDLLNNQVLTDSLNKKFSGLKLKLPPNYVENLVKLTNGHPYYTQQAIRQVILSYVLDGSFPRQKELPEHLLRLEKDYLKKTWESIARNREYEQILLALPSGSTNIYPRLKSKGINVARAQKKLEELGLLLKNEQAGYTIADPLLALWIRKKMGK